MTGAHRVLVIGSGGSGKTTLAGRLSDATGIPVIHLDSLYWRPGWEPTPPAEWEETVRELCRGPAWIMDGNYGGTLDLRMSAADTIVFLDLPRHVCLWRVVKRRIAYRGRTRPSVAPGCPEGLTLEFLLWVWRYPKTRRQGILARLDEARRTKTVVILSSQAEVEAFLSRSRERGGLPEGAS